MCNPMLLIESVGQSQVRSISYLSILAKHWYAGPLEPLQLCLWGRQLGNIAPVGAFVRVALTTGKFLLV